MQKLKRIIALTGAIALIALYLITFILGVTGSADTSRLLMACVVCTVVIPVLLYAMFLTARVLGRRDAQPEDNINPAENTHPKNSSSPAENAHPENSSRPAENAHPEKPSEK